MALGANVELANSFNDWRIRTNEILTELKTAVLRTGNTATGNVSVNGYITLTGVILDTTTGDTRFRRTATKTATFDDGADGAATLTITGNVAATNSASMGATGSLTWTGRTRLSASADGKVLIANNAGTAGAVLDVSTDGTVKLRNRADNADALLTSAAITSSGNVSGVNVSASANVSAVNVGASGNVSAANITASANASITGKITVSDGVELPTGTPAVTTNKLYNDSGTLKFNGASIGGASHYATFAHLHGVSGFTPTPIDGALLTTSIATLYTSSAWTVVTMVRITNTASAARQVNLWLVPSGSSESNARNLFRGSLAAGETVMVPGPLVLEAGDFIRGSQATDSTVAVSFDTIPFASMPSGVTLKPIDGLVGTTTTWVTAYTCPSSTVAVVDFLAVSNLDSSARYVAVARVPSGQSAAARYYIADLGLTNSAFKLTAPETAVVASLMSPFVLEAGDTLQFYTEAGAFINLLGSVREYV
jgi:hypothetical protein